MGKIILPPEVKLVMGLLWGKVQSIRRLKEILEKEFGAIDEESEAWDFSYTDYYVKELGASIQRGFVSFDRPIGPGDLARIKCRTNEMEEHLSLDGCRTVNFDPGYVTPSKLVLATTKEGSYRVYMDRGIYGQSTLYYEKGSYRPWPWTYPDYQDPRTIAFFNAVRKKSREMAVKG